MCIRDRLEGEIRPFLIQQPEEDFVALPDGQFSRLILRHPFQHAFPAGIALHLSLIHISIEHTNVTKMHAFHFFFCLCANFRQIAA